MSTIVYTIDRVQSQKQRALCILIAQGKEQLPAPLKRLNLHNIPFAQSLPILQELAASGKVYFEGRQLVIDCYSKIDFAYYVEKRGEELWLSGLFKYKELQTPLDGVDFFCSHWIIQGISLKKLSHPIKGQLPRPIQISEIETLISNSSLEEEPQVVLAPGVNLQSPDPLPLLILKDRAGACADLWIDYGHHRLPFHDQMTPFPGKRKKEVEKQWEKDLLETDFIKKEVGTSHYYCPVDKVPKSLTFLLEIGWQVVDWKGNRLLRHTAAQLEASEQPTGILISGKLSYEDHQIDLSSLVGAFNRRERFIQLSANTVGLLPETQAYEMFAEEGEIVAEGIKFKKNQIGSLGDLWNSSFTPTASLQELKEKLDHFQGWETALPSEKFVGQLRPYQQKGVDWLHFLHSYGFHGILADEMGLGKTVQVLAFLSRLPLARPALIIAPTSLLFNWRKEIEKFLPSSTLYVHQGSARSKKELPQTGIVLTSYALLRFDAALFANTHWSSVILDEAQAIKNETTLLAQTMSALQADFRLSITGTPIENHLMELWSHFRFLMPDLLGEKEKFQADVLAGESDKRHIKRLQKLTRPFILRRKKEEVAKDLPERIDQTVWVEMNDAQKNCYETYLASAKSGLLKKVELEGAKKHRLEIFETLLRLRQICCHPVLVSDTCLDSAKLELLLADLAEIIEDGRKALVYSQFTSMLTLIGKACSERGWKYAYLDGSTSNREKVVEDFQQNENTPLFLISLKAGGVGLNLTAADTVLLYDPWWNDAVEEQAISRAHRIGQRKSVIAKRYVIAESIEEKMMKLKALKKQLMHELLEGEGMQGEWTIDDLRFLLS